MVLIVLFLIQSVRAETCAAKEKPSSFFKALYVRLVPPRPGDEIYDRLSEAIAAKLEKLEGRPKRWLADKYYDKAAKVPTFGKCGKPLFRATAVDGASDGAISREGYKSGYDRGVRRYADTLPPEAPIEDRIVQYVRVSGADDPFPKDASVVGVTESPHTALFIGDYFRNMRDDKYVRLDEIDICPEAANPKCANLKTYDATKIFADKGLKPWTSTEGEYEVDRAIPAECIVTSYRIRRYP